MASSPLSKFTLPASDVAGMVEAHIESKSFPVLTLVTSRVPKCWHLSRMVQKKDMDIAEVTFILSSTATLKAVESVLPFLHEWGLGPCERYHQRCQKQRILLSLTSESWVEFK